MALAIRLIGVPNKALGRPGFPGAIEPFKSG
jgi:hypothetical protein